MKKMKKIAALLVAMTMIFGMCISAFAADGDVAYDKPLTVTGLSANDVAHFYQVVEWVGNAEGNVGGWKAVAPFDTVLTEAVLTSVLKGTGNPPANPTGITAELAGQLARAATGAGTAVTASGTSVEFNNPDAGLYMALITPADINTVYNPVFVGSDYNKEEGGSVEATSGLSYSDKAAAKKSPTTIDKQASTDEADPDDMKWTSTAIGDTVTFTVTTTIPGFGDVYQSPFFKMTDKLTDLTLVPGSVQITAPTVPSGKATITEGTDEYSIQFASDYLKTIKVPTAVTVTYQAIVATTAPLNVNREKNEVSTEFSHNPNDESDHAFKKDTTQHYTFTIDAEGLGEGEHEKGKKTSELVKVGRDASGQPIIEKTEKSYITETNTWQSPLEGAKFKLYRDADCTQEYIPKNPDGTAGTALDITSGEDGRMTIAGLDAGKYWLQESQAPTGFVTNDQKIPIVITETTKEVEITEYTTDGVNWISEADYNKLTDEQKAEYKSYTYKTDVLDTYNITINGVDTATYHFTNEGNEVAIDWEVVPPVELPFQIINEQGVELPSTGGIGTTIFYIVGAILVLGAGVVLVARRRTNA